MSLFVQVRAFVHSLVDQSLDNWYTRQYDNYQVTTLSQSQISRVTTLSQFRFSLCLCSASYSLPLCPHLSPYLYLSPSLSFYLSLSVSLTHIKDCNLNPPVFSLTLLINPRGIWYQPCSESGPLVA